MLSKLQTLKEEREQGFTLIELLVVILIIGILSAIAIPAFLNQRKAAVDSSVEADVSNASKQVETWMVKNSTSEVPEFFVANEYSGTASTVTATPPTDTALADIKVSEGTELVISPIADERGAYTITGKNDGGEDAKSGYTYNSVEGGRN